MTPPQSTAASRLPKPNIRLPQITQTIALNIHTPDPRPRTDHPLDGEPFHPLKALNHFDRLQALAAGENPSPVTVEIDPSNKCNHKCEWCVSMLAHTGEYLSYETFTDMIGEIEQMDVKSVVLKGGGEPTVHPDFVPMLERLREAKLSVGLITNGSMPRKGTREKIIEHVDWVRVSLDAATAQTHQTIHGTKDFKKIVDNIGWMAANSTRTLVGINFVAEPRNHAEIARFTQMAQDLGVAYVSVRCVFDPRAPLPEDVRAAMLAQARQAKALETDTFRVMLGNLTEQYINAEASQPFPYDKCLGPNMVGVVGAEGEVYACCFLRGNKDFSFGNINDQSFKDIWNSDKRQQIMERVYKGECGRVCQGGMTHNRYNIYNQILNYLTLENKTHADFA
ncbi:MAG: radical SAM protein [Planctomycetota bacterium]